MKTSVQNINSNNNKELDQSKPSISLSSDRLVIDNVAPEINGGLYPIKRVPGETVAVEADIFADGHDEVSARLLYRKEGETAWQGADMEHTGNDRWHGKFVITDQVNYQYTVCAWVDCFQTWQHDLEKKFNAGQDVRVDLQIGAEILEGLVAENRGKDMQTVVRFLQEIRDTKNVNRAVSSALSEKLSAQFKNYPPRDLQMYEKVLNVVVERPKALFSSWYELFPRSWGPGGRHGTFRDSARFLPEIARMGFDILYLPPIHPIGTTNRKGRNNAITAGPEDPGSPWAIGSSEGGHKAVHPQLGTMDDFASLVEQAKHYGIEIALDLAYQCSPDHPYVKEHPQWFKWRPDGTVQYAENPPKKYEDVLPINFETEDRENLWLELKSIVDFWVQKGVRIFRVDNPHTKPFKFWEWLIREIRQDHPDVIFLAEAFTRPKVMKRLAKAGFTQSYTYFTWRTGKWDFEQYVTELTRTDMRDVFRPNFWPNTPDILPFHLQTGGRPMFIIRLVLAATLSSNYGVYGPAFDLCDHDAAADKEEYVNSEKYELREWDWDRYGNIKDLMARINAIRKGNPALQTTWNTRFCEIQNDQMLCYTKATDDRSNRLLIVVNLDPYHQQGAWLRLPLAELDIPANEPYRMTDLISEDVYTWQGEWNFVQLNPYTLPIHIFLIDKV